MPQYEFFQYWTLAPQQAFVSWVWMTRAAAYQWVTSLQVGEAFTQQRVAELREANGQPVSLPIGA